MVMDGVRGLTTASGQNDTPLYNGLNTADFRIPVEQTANGKPNSEYLNLTSLQKWDARDLKLDNKKIDFEKYRDHSIDAFREAIDKNKPLVLVVSEDWCGYCKNLEKELGKPAVQNFKDKAVFSISSPTKDKGCAAIAGSLNIDAYPTITVLEPEARMLLERGRINGYFTGEKLGEHLDTIINKTPPRKYEEQPQILLVKDDSGRSRTA
jgi:Thioredoxin.